MYKEYKTQGGVVGGVFRLSDMAAIPADPNNRDYAEYLRWLEAGNQPLPADE
jgi:hypothetical protein